LALRRILPKVLWFTASTD